MFKVSDTRPSSAVLWKQSSILKKYLKSTLHSTNMRLLTQTNTKF